MNFLNRIMPFALLHYSQHPTVWNADVMVGALVAALDCEDKGHPSGWDSGEWEEV